MAEREPTLTLSQIAALAGVRASAVSNWRKRFDDFPQAVATAPGGRDLYSLREIEAWLLAHDRFDPGRKSEKLLFEAANVLRGQTPADEGIALLASAIALSEYCDRNGISTHADVNERIASLERQSPGLVGLFEPLSRLDPTSASQLMELTDAIEASRRADVFEWVLSQRRRFIETRTSEEITELLVALTGDAETVLDPAAGEAGVLTAIALASEDRVGLELYGQEINEAAWRIGEQRLFLHLVFGSIENAESLLDDQFPELRVDAVVCDPPYGMNNPFRSMGGEVSRDASWAFALTQVRTADFLWIEYAIDHLKPDGAGYVVLPAGTLFRKGRERELRMDLLRRDAVEAVITLPPGAGERTAIPLVVWVVRQSQVSAGAPVLIIDAAGSADASGVRLGSQIPQIEETLRTWRAAGQIAPLADFAAAVSPVDLLAADADLSPARWLAPPTTSPEAHQRAIEDSLERLRADQRLLIQEAPAIDYSLTEPVGEWVSVRQLAEDGIAEIIRGVRVKPEDCQDDGVVRLLRTRDIGENGIAADELCFVVLDDLKPKPPLTEPGDIVISPASGRLRAVIDKDGRSALASPLQALRFRVPWLDSKVAAAFLASPRNRRFATGLTSGYARVDVRDLELPHLAPSAAEQLRQTLDGLAETERRALTLASSARAARHAMLGAADGLKEDH